MSERIEVPTCYRMESNDEDGYTDKTYCAGCGGILASHEGGVHSSGDGHADYCPSFEDEEPEMLCTCVECDITWVFPRWWTGPECGECGDELAEDDPVATSEGA